MLIPFMTSEPRTYSVPYDVYFQLRRYSDKERIPISTIARSFIEQFKADDPELSRDDIEALYKSLGRHEFVNLTVRLHPNVIDWIKAKAQKIGLTSGSPLVAYIIHKKLSEKAGGVSEI